MPSISTTTRSVDPATTPTAATCPVCGSPVRADGGCTSATCFNRVNAMSEATLAALRPTMLRYALRITGDLDQAEDAVQDALVDAWKKRDQWPTIVDPTGWLLRITRYSVLHMRDKDRRTLPVDFLADVAVDGHRSATADLPCMADRATAKVVYRRLKKLPRRQREAVRGRLLRGKSYQEVADQMGVSTNAVVWHVNQALNRLEAAPRPRLRVAR